MFFHIFGLSFQIAVDQGPVIRRPVIFNVVNVGFNFIPSSCFVSLKLSETSPLESEEFSV